MTTKSRTTKQAEKECRAAWAANPNATHGWCIHHEQEWEELTEPISNRIDYILKHKPTDELITRFDNMRPMSEESLAIVASAWKVYNEAIESAQKVYNEAIESAWKVYNEAIAHAQKVYREATASAWKVYNETIAPAWKVYNETIASAHKKDVPQSTWNGESIF